MLQRIRTGTDDVYRFLLESWIILGPRKGTFSAVLTVFHASSPQKKQLTAVPEVLDCVRPDLG